MSEFGQVEQPIEQPSDKNHVREGVKIEPINARDKEEWDRVINVESLERALSEGRHLRDITPHFRTDISFRSIKYILEDWKEFFESYLTYACDDLTLADTIWIKIRLKHINEVLGHNHG